MVLNLPNEGEELYKIATRLEKEIHSSEQDILKIINKEITFKLGCILYYRYLYYPWTMSKYYW